MAGPEGKAVQVREAQDADADGIARVHVDAWRETYSRVVPESYFSAAALERRRQFWTRYLALEPRPGRLAVATLDGEIVGFANSGEARGEDAEHGHPPLRSLHLFSIYLLAAQHGTGGGQALLEQVLGSKPAQLWVLSGNERAIAFYRRNGFRPDGATYQDPREPGLLEERMVR